jgi:hypothetical protein
VAKPKPWRRGFAMPRNRADFEVIVSAFRQGKEG